MKSYGVTFQMKPLWLYSRMNDDITWPRRDVKFLIKCWKIFNSFAALAREIFFDTRREILYL